MIQVSPLNFNRVSTTRLPIDFTAADSSRTFDCIQYVGDEPEDEAIDEVGRLIASTMDYSPEAFWEGQDCYIQMLVEKIDLRTLFKPICKRYYLPIANAKGWSDLNQRYDMMKRFRYWESRGKQCILLYCGDFDCEGTQISDKLMKNMMDLEKAVKWSPESVQIDRFGLNQDFIEQYGLSWIDGLKTGSGGDLADPKHPFHKRPYVQEWLRNIGPRKVEANALVTRPDEGRELCEAAINHYVPADAAEEFEARIAPARDELLSQVKTRLLDDDLVARIKKEMISGNE